MRVIVKNLQKRITISPTQIRRIANKISAPPRFENLKLNLYFVKNSVIKRLNKQFFGRNCLTDVISFNLGDDYGEVFIAPSVAKRNAVKYRAGVKEELYRCTIHGILHALGFSDLKEKEKEKMWMRQESLLRGIIFNEEN